VRGLRVMAGISGASHRSTVSGLGTANRSTLVLDKKLLSKTFAELLAHEARERVSHPTRYESNDQTYRPRPGRSAPRQFAARRKARQHLRPNAEIVDAEFSSLPPATISMGGFALAFVVGEVEDGAAFIDRAVVLNPNLAAGWFLSGWVNVYLGKPDVTIERATRAIHLSPLHRFTFPTHTIIGAGFQRWPV